MLIYLTMERVCSRQSWRKRPGDTLGVRTRRVLCFWSPGYAVGQLVGNCGGCWHRKRVDDDEAPRWT